MTDLSGTGGTLASGPESRYVVDALGHILDGSATAGRASLDAGAALTSWAAILRRLDVAGRALALDAGLDPLDSARWARQVAALAAAASCETPECVAEVLAAWSAGIGLPVAIDLVADAVDAVAEDDRAFAACLVLAWLVDVSGFPPQVVA
ncbi:MAG: hypothetical protein ACLGIC_04450 [Acidimicrobiia bacterium]